MGGSVGISQWSLTTPLGWYGTGVSGVAARLSRLGRVTVDGSSRRTVALTRCRLECNGCSSPTGDTDRTVTADRRPLARSTLFRLVGYIRGRVQYKCHPMAGEVVSVQCLTGAGGTTVVILL